MRLVRKHASRLARQVAFCIGGGAIFGVAPHTARAYDFGASPSFLSQIQAEQESLLQIPSVRTYLGTELLFSGAQAEQGGLLQNSTVGAELGTGALFSQLQAEEEGLLQISSVQAELATESLDVTLQDAGAGRRGPIIPRQSGGGDLWQPGWLGDTRFHMRRDGWIEDKWGPAGRHPFCFSECGGIAPPSAIPEPDKMLLSLAGLLTLLFAVRRRQRKHATH